MPDAVNVSRMEKRLDEQIARAATPHAANCLRADLAAHLARLGRFDEARQLLEPLRRGNEKKPKAELSIRLHFAEGLLAYFSSGGIISADGVQRAHALSVATGLKHLQALCAAWLANWAYARDDTTVLCRYVVESLQLAAPDDHASRARANLVVAQVLHLAGRLDLAKPWYLRAKEHATAGFDDATIGALLHNMSWHRMLVLRQAALTNADEADAGRHAMMNAESTEHFDQITGNDRWPALKPILRAQILSLQGEPGQALALYEAHLSDQDIPARWQANLVADKARCHAVLGQVDQARQCVELALANLANEIQTDDRAATHSLLAQVFAHTGQAAEAARHRALAEGLWAQVNALLCDAVERLSAFDENGRPLMSAEAAGAP